MSLGPTPLLVSTPYPVPKPHHCQKVKQTCHTFCKYGRNHEEYWLICKDGFLGYGYIGYRLKHWPYAK